MSIPITGILLIPLGLIIALLPWRYCLLGLVSFAMMSPAAVVNVGSFGLQPGYYLALLLIARTLGGVMARGFTLNAFAISRMRPLWWFAVTVFAVLFIALCFFQGNVDTLPGTSGFNSSLAHPFRLARENFTQIAYLLLNFTLVYCLAHNGARQPSDRLVAAWDTAIVCALCFAAFVCIWQFVSFYSGLYFPADFFYSNAGFNRADSQAMMGLSRINGPFEEPSALGYHFTGLLFYAWGRYRVSPTPLTIGMIAVCILCLLASTSTTAIVGLGLFACLVIYDVSTGKMSLMPRRARLSLTGLTVLGVIFVTVIAAAFAAAANWAAISIVLDKVLFDKTGSLSFQQRSFADYLALKILTQTYGIGVGLGSHKANSLLLTLLSNTGLIGVLLFGWFVVSMLRWKRAPDSSQTLPSTAIRPLQLYLLGLLTIHLISDPNLSVLTLWVLLGALLGIQTSEHRTAGVAPATLGLVRGLPGRLAGAVRRSPL